MTEDVPTKHRPWLERLTDAFLREPQDREQLLHLLQDAKDRHIIANDAWKMIAGVLQVSEMKVRDAMIPRSRMITVYEQFTIQEALPLIVEHEHSRYPVLAEGGYKVLGILLAKDLIKYAFSGSHDNIRIKQLIRPALFVPESKRLDVLLREFRLSRNHIAIVIDEYGAIAGLITIEDVLEEIVGEIEDEYDIAQDPNIQAMDGDHYVVNALTPVAEFNEFFKTHFSHDGIDTVGGLILQKLSHLPEKGEQIELGPFLFTVVDASNRGIKMLSVRRQHLDQETGEDDEFEPTL